MEDNFISSDSSDYLSRIDSWTLRLYSVQHFDEAVKMFCSEAYEGLQCRNVIFFKYLKSFSSLIATHSEGIEFSEIRGQGLNFSKDKNFSPIKDLLRIQQNKTFVDIMKKNSPNHDYQTAICVAGGEVRGLFVFTDIAQRSLESSYYKVIERIFSHWVSEIILSEKNHNLNRLDELTELLNKSVFRDYVALEVGRAQRIKHPVSFMVVRLDKINVLKEILNLDRYQSLLKMISKILVQTSRKTDHVGVLSEGEFGVLFPHMSIKNARAKARQVKNILESAKYFEDFSANIQISFSVCISEYPTLAHDFEDLQMATVQKIMIEENSEQIHEVSKGEGFIPDFKYSEGGN